MQLTNYTTLCMDAHGVLIDRDRDILRGLSSLLAMMPKPPPRKQILEDYVHALHELTDEQMGAVSAHCIVYRALANRWGVETGWQQSIEFASSLGFGTLYEDAPGAIHYLRKFYQLKVVTSLNEQEFVAFNQRMGLSGLERLTTGSFVAARSKIREIETDSNVLLLTAGPASTNSQAGHCRITRNAIANQPIGKAFISLSDFIYAHQLALRGELI
ncbi:hypothetical protein [Vreelandella olivaria]|uniref:hypothetical protein n=1 Tax=Vreelandella olivaria TaxID=390919 RepID=UPI00201EA0A4|nr:hypothetical protein [Halomonas olivaria]